MDQTAGGLGDTRLHHGYYIPYHSMEGGRETETEKLIESFNVFDGAGNDY